MISLDSIAYRRWEVVPLNIILYNVFSGPGRGPGLYGTEPWWYYVFNLFLYFNVITVSALLSLPLCVDPL
jgi:alpha-1,2-mannosyltransferase